MGFRRRFTMKQTMETFSVLVVDDDNLVRETVSIFLQREGITVHTASSGTKALEKLEQTKFQVVVTDLKMPGIDGLSLLKQIREKYSSTFVIVMTAYGSIATAVDAMKHGAFDYIEKPLVLAKIKKAIEKLTSKRVQLQAPQDDIKHQEPGEQQELIKKLLEDMNKELSDAQTQRANLKFLVESLSLQSTDAPSNYENIMWSFIAPIVKLDSEEFTVEQALQFLENRVKCFEYAIAVISSSCVKRET